MNIIRRWILGKLTVNELVEYFHSIGIEIDMTFKRKQQPRYYAKNSKLYKIKHDKPKA